jgi:hypothetical protein
VSQRDASSELNKLELMQRINALNKERERLQSARAAQAQREQLGAEQREAHMHERKGMLDAVNAELQRVLDDNAALKEAVEQQRAEHDKLLAQRSQDAFVLRAQLADEEEQRRAEAAKRPSLDTQLSLQRLMQTKQMDDVSHEITSYATRLEQQLAEFRSANTALAAENRALHEQRSQLAHANTQFAADSRVLLKQNKTLIDEQKENQKPVAAAAMSSAEDTRMLSLLKEQFLGDYLGLGVNTRVLQLIMSFKDSQILFSDVVRKLFPSSSGGGGGRGSNAAEHKRVLLLTGHAVYNRGLVPRLTPHRRMPVVDILSVSLSRLSAELCVLHMRSGRDFMFKSAKRTEIVYHLRRAYAAAASANHSGGDAAVLHCNYGERIFVAEKPGSGGAAAAAAATTISSGVSTARTVHVPATQHIVVSRVQTLRPDATISSSSSSSSSLKTAV